MPNPKLETYKNKETNTVYDFTDADAQSQLTAIKDGTTIDSFGDVETALSTKYDINDESQISILDYDYVPYYADAESATRKIYWTNIKNGLKSFFDDLYCAIGLVPSGASSSNKLATASDVTGLRSEQVVMGAVNRLHIDLNSKTTQNVVITVDKKAGTVNLNGTNNGVQFSEAFCDLTANDLEAGTYEINTFATPDSTKYYIGIDARLNGSWVKSLVTLDTVSKKSFTLDWNGYDVARVFIVVKASQQVSNLLVKPMIATDTSVFAPFAMTNKQLTDKVVKSKDKAQVKLADLTWTQTSTGGYVSSVITVGDDVNNIVSVIPYDYGGLLATTVVTPMVYSNNQFKLLANTDTFTQYQYFSYRVWYI